ncbi:choline-responsive transcriptional repressor BetI [Gemmobacter sp.]|uniref:choline-binding transcriptional repressor BetI n=1 Tax=Gemmobacter sp. TaxID=1898957 RepID=UPI002AFFAE9A|nr:transcriptional regulator BetI [Gemmobacter sp.]
MPRPCVEPIRKAALVEAVISEIGLAGSLDVTVSQIARRAGMSAALAHHYFGSKEDMFLAAMRHVLTVYGAEVRGALAAADGAEARLTAILRASFGPANFRREVVAAWLTFWIMAQTVPQARRLLTIYESRLRSNLTACLRPLAGAEAPRLAEAAGAMIDGVYLRQALARTPPDGKASVALIRAMLTAELAVIRGQSVTG